MCVCGGGGGEREREIERERESTGLCTLLRKRGVRSLLGAAANPRRFGGNIQDMHTGSSAVFQLLLSFSFFFFFFFNSAGRGDLTGSQND